MQGAGREAGGTWAARRAVWAYGRFLPPGMGVVKGGSVVRNKSGKRVSGGNIRGKIGVEGERGRGRPRKVDPREARIVELEAEVARLKRHHPAIVAACRGAHGERCQCTYCRSAG